MKTWARRGGEARGGEGRRGEGKGLELIAFGEISLSKVFLFGCVFL